MYCLYHMRVFSATVAFQQNLRRYGIGQVMTWRHMSNTDVDVDTSRTIKVDQTGTAATSSPCSTASTTSKPVVDLRFMYRTLLNVTLCKACCIVTTTPSPHEYDFTTSTLPGVRNNHREEIVYTDEDHDLLTEEVIFGKSKERNTKGEVNKRRLNTFLGGRIALRRAFKSLPEGHDCQMVPSPLLSNYWGAPTLPSFITASISHKDNLAVGLAKFDSAGSVGVDLEHCNNKAATTIMRRVITKNEKDNLGKLREVSTEEEVLLRFSFKEAIYKAIHPFIPRSIDFAEVEVQPLDNGKAEINFALKTGENFEYDASWQRYRNKYWLTCVYVRDPSGLLKRYSDG